jgi:hypothetical protein
MKIAGLACILFGSAGLSLGLYLVYLWWWIHPEMTPPQLFWAYWPLYAIEALCWGAALMGFEISLRVKA